MTDDKPTEPIAGFDMGGESWSACGRCGTRLCAHMSKSIGVLQERSLSLAAEVERLRAERQATNGCADGHEPIRWEPAFGKGCPYCILRAENAALRATIAARDRMMDDMANKAVVRDAEIERLSIRLNSALSPDPALRAEIRRLEDLIVRLIAIGESEEWTEENERFGDELRAEARAILARREGSR